MEGVACMNGMCASSKCVVEWRKGWPLRSGGFATLCENCGTAYQQLTFCEMFHSQETGWRECTSCGKRLHCGCIASSPLLELLDTGGVNCKGCSNTSNLPSPPYEEKRKACFGQPTENGIINRDDCQQHMPPSKSVGTRILENDVTCSGEVGIISFSSFNLPPVGPSKDYDPLRENRSAKKSVPKSLVPTDLSIGLSTPSHSNTLSGDVNAEERQLSSIGMCSFRQGSAPRHLLPSSVLAAGLQTSSSSSTISQLRVARPPVEGRIKNQLLPRYWPRITDQELQQISGDSNSTIVPLFEKVLSVSDASRIGRLVLPKACAEAYFPPVSLPEGLPLRIQDVKGKEWVFQFRFWPNNNSRMYVLEGVTPCIQSMQLQAGDTVTFSRMDPGGKLLMGFRKASNTTSLLKDSHYSMNSGAFQGEPLLGNAENLPTLQPERKRRNIGPKSKRLLIDGHDSMELTLSWEEVQDMLRPPPTVKPSTYSVEDHEFEEFDEPPVLGKRSIFIVRLSGEQEQWTQCDSCFKWRKMPVDFLLPPKWTCQDNIYDRTRCSCSAPDELSSRELEKMLKMNKDITTMRIETSPKPVHEHESQAVATTTKHPRHRPGCSCIVCIQPPSGKGKHKPTCICNVCMTVRRRFKTLMMRKKKRQSEREAEIAHGNHIVPAAAAAAAAAEEEAKVNNNAKRSESEILSRCPSEGRSQETAEIFKGGLDLNCCPGPEEITASSQVSMMSLLQEASLPLETYLRQNGLTSLVSDQQAPVENTAIAQTQEEDHGISNAAIQEHKEGSHEFSENDQRENDPS